ncbi:MAG: bifunctional glutamate N-acetyltransferase/amino-acid acetyltransferase ArgJ [Gracilibacteraceae bacterium]|jgi:glutamate N-acetyltransferase/amino-acid N-acetyltransferase|nr:bifunctional glutamate N-acetyltransferase/amino-acid acetyltransferase ArgJ [Gracilibacteraceae bacterium]
MRVIKGGVAAPVGFLAAGVQAGVKYENKYDVALLYSLRPAAAAAVYTRNAVQAHPLVLTRAHLADGVAQAVAVNSGNANACMGKQGEEAALAMAQAAAGALGLRPADVLVASTGVIGQPLPLDKIRAGLAAAGAQISDLRAGAADGTAAAAAASPCGPRRAEAAHRAAQAIMTTDLTVKEMAWEIACAAGPVRLGVMAKGSGMIHPNMGTMLCFITTDAALPAPLLREMLREAVDDSFNMVTVDGDTSTNDMAVALANGCSGVELSGDERELFRRALNTACVAMARAIAQDGEGAGKLLETRVSGAAGRDDARKIARAVCASNLVKTAMGGEDANWGRIIAAAGYSGAEFDPGRVAISLNGLPVAAAGEGLPFSEAEAKERLSRDEIVIEIFLAAGNAQATAWGCDLTAAYVDINAGYRS